MRLVRSYATLLVALVCATWLPASRAYLGDASFESDVVESLMQALAEDEGNDEVSAQAAAPKTSLRSMNGAEKKEPQVKCMWPLYITAKTYNLALPDTNAVYQAMVLEGITSTNIIHIRGQFPKVRYFSYQTYEPEAGRPVSSLPDFKITPESDAMVNPFASKPPSTQPEPSLTSTNFYSLYVTPSGKMGLPNELAATNSTAAAAKCDSEAPCKCVIFFRLYIGDAEYDPYDHKADVAMVRWGSVHPPSVKKETYDKPPTRASLFGNSAIPPPATATPMAQCPPGTQAQVTKRLYKTQKDKMVVHNGFNGSKIDNTNDNFILYTGKKHFTPYPNQDSEYLFSPANPGLLSPYLLFATIGGVLPKTPQGLSSAPFIGEPRTYDVRFVSFSSMNPGAFQPVIDELMDKQIEAFYASKPGAFADRKFKIVAGPDTEAAIKCGLYKADESMFMSTQPSIKNRQLGEALSDAPELLAFVYRQILSRGEVAGVPDGSIDTARKVCSNLGPSACFSKDTFKRVMGGQYPSITYHACDPLTGQVVDVATAMTQAPALQAMMIAQDKGKKGKNNKRAMQAPAAAGGPAPVEEISDYAECECPEGDDECLCECYCDDDCEEGTPDCEEEEEEEEDDCKEGDPECECKEGDPDCEDDELECECEEDEVVNGTAPAVAEGTGAVAVGTPAAPAAAPATKRKLKKSRRKLRKLRAKRRAHRKMTTRVRLGYDGSLSP